MTPERQRTVSLIFNAARDLDPAQRDEFLSRECAGDETLRAELLEWLEADAKADRTENMPAAISLGSGDLIAGRYRIVRFIARGGMGEVYEAEDLELNGRVALKTLLPAIASDPRMIARFKQEIQLSRKIAHPNVCKVYDVDRHPPGSAPAQIILLSMEYVEGETLAHKLQRAGPLGVAEALPLVRQMAAALDAAHAAGVIHRDFKTSNVMLAPAGGSVRVVVTDFGLARTTEKDGESTASIPGRIAGTLDYMAPELLSGGPASIASDVYALGMTIYRMVTGTRPFAADAPLTAALRRAREPVPAPRAVMPELDERWNAAVARCLEADPVQRFASAGDVLRAIEGQAVAPAPRRAIWTRGRLSIAVLAIVLTAVLAYAFWPRPFRPPPEAARLYQIGTDDLQAGAYFAATKELGEAARLGKNFGMAQARLAEAWTELGSQDKAGEEMLRARRAAAVTHLPQLDRVYLDAVELTITRQFPEAAQKYEAMVKYAGPAAAAVRLDLGRAYEKAGKLADARRNYLMAAQGPPRSAAAWLRLAVLDNQKGDFQSADREFQQAAQLYEVTSNQEGLTEVAYQRGVAANRRGEMEAAEQFLREAVRIAEVTRNVQQEISAKLQLGSTAALSGDADAAAKYAQEAIDTATVNRIESLATRGLLVLGDAYGRKQNVEQAEKNYQMGLALARRDDSRRWAASAELRLASLHDSYQRVDKSVPEAREALAFFQPNNFARETMQCNLILGRANEYQGRYDEALTFFHPALDTAEKLQDGYQIMLAQEGMGDGLMGKEEFPEALGHYEKQLEVSTARHDVEHIGWAALHCGNALWLLGRYAEAHAKFDQADAAAAKFPSLRQVIAENRAEMSLSEGKYAETIAQCRRALGLVSKDEADLSADFNRLLGLALIRGGHKQDGRPYCERSLEIAATLPDAPVLAAANLAAAEARLETGDFKGALAAVQAVAARSSNLPESNWQANALEARISAALQDRDAEKREALAAQVQLNAIERHWGVVVFQAYHARPDLQRMWRPLLRMVSAN